MGFVDVSMYYLCDELVIFGFMPIIKEILKEFRKGLVISSISHEEDVIIYPYADSDKEFMMQPHGVVGQSFQIYACVMSDFRVKILFTLFYSDILGTINIAPFNFNLTIRHL